MLNHSKMDEKRERGDEINSMCVCVCCDKRSEIRTRRWPWKIGVISRRQALNFFKQRFAESLDSPYVREYVHVQRHFP
jgi:hypothetical protein